MQFWSKNYIEYEGQHDKSKMLSFEECLDKIRLYLKTSKNSHKENSINNSS